MSFPDMSRVEVIGPLVPVPESSKVLAQLESGGYRAAPTSAVDYTRRSSVISLRVDRDYLPEFLDALNDSRGSLLSFSLPGYDPFGNDTGESGVYFQDNDTPVREAGGVTHVGNITLLFVVQAS